MRLPSECYQGALWNLAFAGVAEGYANRARPCRTELDVSLCFAPLLRWVLSWWLPTGWRWR